MNMDRQNAPSSPSPQRTAIDLDSLLQATLRGLGDAEEKITTLSALLLTGRPDAIAGATSVFEQQLAGVEELLRQCSLKLAALGLPSFRDAVRVFHHQGQTTRAMLLEGILKQLTRIVSCCHAGARRASQLDRELTRAMSGLRDSDAAAGSRLIASA